MFHKTSVVSFSFYKIKHLKKTISSSVLYYLYVWCGRNTSQVHQFPTFMSFINIHFHYFDIFIRNVTIQLSYKHLSCDVCESQVYSRPSLSYLSLSQFYYCPCNVTAVKTSPRAHNQCCYYFYFWLWLCVIYTHMCHGLHTNVIFSHKSLRCRFRVHVLDWIIFCSFTELFLFAILTSARRVLDWLFIMFCSLTSARRRMAPFL